MAIYQIQNASGQVHGQFPLPEWSPFTTSEWCERIRAGLPAEIIGINGVREGNPSVDSESGIAIEKVVVDLELGGDLKEKVARVHELIGTIALGEAPEIAPPPEVASSHKPKGLNWLFNRVVNRLLRP